MPPKITTELRRICAQLPQSANAMLAAEGPDGGLTQGTAAEQIETANARLAAQLAELHAASQLTAEPVRLAVRGDMATLELELPAYGVAHLSVAFS